jgi:hypothetical protein
LVLGGRFPNAATTANAETLAVMLTMELHEDKEINRYTNVMKVPGGWIYRFFHENENSDEQPIFRSAVFVPFPNDSVKIKS